MRAKLYSHPLRAALREVQPFYWLEYTKQQLPEIDVPEGYEDPPLDDRLWLRESRRVQLLPPAAAICRSSMSLSTVWPSGTSAGAASDRYLSNILKHRRLAAESIRAEFGRLDLLVNNAGISNTRRGGFTMQEYANESKASTASLEEIRAVWDVTSSAWSPSTRPCCCCESRRTPASSTCRAESDRSRRMRTRTTPTTRCSDRSIRRPRRRSTR